VNELSVAANLASVRRADLRRRAGKPFFVAMSVLLLIVVVIGFGRTLFFRAAFDVPPIPPYLFVHGAVLTSWFLWVLVQSSLVAAHRTDLHRRFGVVGVGLAGCVVVVTVVTGLSFLPRMRASGADFEAAALPLTTTVITTWLTLADFIVLVTLAVAYRRRPEIHKRLMLWASIIIVGAAGSRIPATLAATGLSPTLAVMPLVLLTVCPVAYDVVVRGRPHIATIVCLALQMLTVFATNVLAAKETVQGFVLNLH